MATMGPEDGAADAASLDRALALAGVVPWEYDTAAGRFVRVGTGDGPVFGCPREVWLTEQFFGTRVHPVDRTRVKEHFSGLAKGEKRPPCDFRLLLSPGELVWVRSIVASSTHGEGSHAIEGVLLNVSESKREQEEKERTQHELAEARRAEMAGRLACGIVREFNNVLGIVLANVSLLKRKTLLAEAVEPGLLSECLTDMGSAVERAAGLAKSLLDLSQRQAFGRDFVDVGILARDALRLLGHVADRAVEIDATIEEGLVVLGDRSALQNLALGLCLHALESMPRGGRLGVHARRETLAQGDPRLGAASLSEGTYVLFDVTQAGTPPAGPARSGTVGSRPTGDGSVRPPGADLALFYHIARDHDGRIVATGKAGAGSTFTVFLPAAKFHGVLGESEKRPKEAYGLVLLVDDEEMVLRGGRRLLEELGYEVLCAENGEEAVRIFREKKEEIRAVVLDLSMPKMSGARTYDALRELDPDVAVVVASGFSRDLGPGELLARGARAFVHKPYGIAELASALARALRAV